jgi:hypothetical protein
MFDHKNTGNTKMKISRILTKICGSFLVVAILFLTAGATRAQTDSVKKKRLKSPAAVKGFVGGEAHDSYVISARKNQTLKVQISWLGGGDNKAQFVISKSDDFFAGDVVEGGSETYDGKSQTRKIPATGDYYIYVTAHPTAKYTLKVTVK